VYLYPFEVEVNGIEKPLEKKIKTTKTLLEWDGIDPVFVTKLPKWVKLFGVKQF
jgi:hypothetical protein